MYYLISQGASFGIRSYSINKIIQVRNEWMCLKMSSDLFKEIEEIMAGMKCPKNFHCAQSGFTELCKARDFGVEKYLDCLENNPRECPFALSFGYGYLCQCPLRVYISKKLKK
jgi:hypothetical protein